MKLKVGLAVISFTVLALLWPWRTRTVPNNILLITIDTLRADYLSCLGSRKSATPNLDALAARGALFEHAYAQCDRTPQSHMSILTSRYVSQILTPQPGTEAYPTLAEILHRRGYHTVAMPSVALLNPDVTLTDQPRKLSFGLGFDQFVAVAEPSGGEDVPVAERDGGDTNSKAIPWLRQESRAVRPWFLWLHYFDCHEHLPLRLATDDLDYIAAVKKVDTLLGEVVGTLRRSGQESNTTIVVTADHGQALGEHEFRFHAGLYESIVHVPLIWVSPGKVAPTRVQQAVENVDIAPTLVGNMSGFYGHNLFERTAQTPVFAETRAIEARMVMTDGSKFIDYARDLSEPYQDMPTSWYARRDHRNPSRGIYRPAGLRELFDCKQDAAELHNQASAEKGRAKQMADILDNKLGHNVREETVRRFRAVGY